MGIGFSTSLNGVNASLLNSDVRANNISNVNTKGYKQKRAESSEGISGPQVKSISSDFRQGSLSITNNPLDVSVNGPGFIQLENSEGEKFYSRSLNMQIDADGRLTDGQGHYVSGAEGELSYSNNIVVQPDGKIFAQGGEGELVQVGEIMVMEFNNPNGLKTGPDGLLQATSNSGEPGLSATSDVRQGALENSNVDLAEQITGQMANEASLKANLAAIKSQDEMLGEIVDLKG